MNGIIQFWDLEIMYRKECEIILRIFSILNAHFFQFTPYYLIFLFLQGMEFHEELHNLGAKEGLKGRKLNKATESFAWNITVLKVREIPRSYLCLHFSPPYFSGVLSIVAEFEFLRSLITRLVLLGVGRASLRWTHFT